MKSYSPKLIIKLWQKSQSLASTNPKASKQIKELLKEVRVSNAKTIKRAQLEILLKGIIKEVVQGMQRLDDPNFGDEGYRDNTLLSACCAAPPMGEVSHTKDGECSKCGDITTFSKTKKTDEQSGSGAAGGGGGTGASVTANVSPVTGPMAFSRKHPKETIEPLGGMEEEREEAFYRDAQDREHDAAQARHELEIIDKAGLTKEYDALMKDIFNLPLAEFDKRASAIHQLKVKAFEKMGVPLTEMTTTMSGTPGYNIPGCFSKKGGSKAGVEGSEAIGYTLTPIGKDEMERRADKLLESMIQELREGKDQPLTHGKPICRFCNKPMSYAGQLQCKHCGKMQGEPRWSKPATYIPKGKVQESQGFGANFDTAQRKRDNEDPPSDHNCKKDGHSPGKKKYRTIGGDQEWEAKCTVCGKTISSVD